MYIAKMRRCLSLLIRRRGRTAFLKKVPSTGRILDVGCGNNSPYIIKNILPSCHYTGLDVGNYNQTTPLLADEYIVTSAENFAQEIFLRPDQFDAVISSHNLEHCNDRQQTLRAMLGALNTGGYIYLAFPCEESIGFPSRTGTLNYFDDETHQGLPPGFSEVISTLMQNNFKILFKKRPYRPIFFYILGFLLEPWSNLKKANLRDTWEYYGFESIIWAQKK